MIDRAVSQLEDKRLSEMLRIDEVCRRFETALKDGPRPRIEDYLVDMPEPEPSALLKELVTLEVVYRQQAGELPSQEEYLSRFPKHQDLLRPLLEMICSVPAKEGRDQGGNPAAADCSARPTEPLVACQEPVTAITSEPVTTALRPAMPVEPESSLPEIPGFEVQGLLGRGGMGIVYLAWQPKLERKVALKVLPPAVAADPERLKRFRNEAQIAAKLADCRIVPVLDIMEAHGSPILVMQFIEGCDLGRIVADRQAVRARKSAEGPHPWAMLSDRAYLDQLLPVLDMVLESVVALHQGQVIHRDIKPSNILIDQRNNAWLSDFGLARLGQQAVMTEPGAGMGTRGYMSPEQWEGREDIDHLADLFSVGATLYHCLTLELPYGRAVVKNESAPPILPSKRQPVLSRDFDAVLLKALEPERCNRYASVKELQDDWRRARRGLFPKARRVTRIRRTGRQIRRHPWTAVVILLALMVSIGSFALHRKAVSGRAIKLEFEPAATRVVLVPTDENGVLREREKLDRQFNARAEFPLEGISPGHYLVVAIAADGSFHEVFRTVPSLGQNPPDTYFPHRSWTELGDGAVALPRIAIKSTPDVVREMALFKKRRFEIGDNKNPGKTLPKHTRWVEAFYVDTTEVSVASFREIMKALPANMPLQVGKDRNAITYVTFDEAVAFSEKVGKRLLYEHEYESVATNGGNSRFPWKDQTQAITAWPFGLVGEPLFDHTETDPPVFGLFSNAVEWTLTPASEIPPGWDRRLPQDENLMADLRGAQIVRGGPLSVARGQPPLQGGFNGPEWEPRHRYALKRNVALPGLGFRCARAERAPYVSP